MATGVQIFNNDNNILIDQNFENLRLIKIIHFGYEGYSVRCSSPYDRLELQQAAGYLYNPGTIYLIEIPTNTFICAVVPRNNAPFSYEVFNVGEKREAYVTIHHGWNDGQPDLDIYCFGLPENNTPDPSHKYGLQVFKEDGTVAFDALNTDYMTVVDYRLVEIPIVDCIRLSKKKDYLRIRGLKDVAYSFYATSFSVMNYNDPDITYIVKPCIRGAGEGVDIGLMNYQAQGANPVRYRLDDDERKRPITIPVLCIDISKYKDRKPT